MVYERLTKEEIISMLADPFSRENASQLSLKILKFYLRTSVEVYNDGQLVFKGRLFDFLNDNQFQESVVELCNGLKKSTQVTECYISGQWVIVKLN